MGSSRAGRRPGRKAKKNIVGTWQFSHHWNSYKNNGEPGTKSTNPAMLQTAYTFYEDGYVVIWSLDPITNKMVTTRYTWGIVYIENNKGKKVATIKILDSAIDPKNQQAIEISTSGKSYYIVQHSKTFLSWIPIPKNGSINSRDNQNTFKKITSTPPSVEQGL